MALVKSTTDTIKKPRLRERTERSYFSRLLWHPARKWVYSFNPGASTGPG